MKWTIAFYLSLVQLSAANQTCVDMRVTMGMHATGYVQAGAAKSFVNAESKLDCIAFCYFKGVKIAMTYDPGTLKCTCYNVLLSTGTAAPGAFAYELTGEPKPDILAGKRNAICLSAMSSTKSALLYFLTHDLCVTLQSQFGKCVLPVAHHLSFTINNLFICHYWL